MFSSAMAFLIVKGKYIIRFEELRTAYVPSAKEDDDDNEGGDLAKYRHF